MTTYQTIRDMIQTKLEAVADIQEVYRYPTQQFQGYPAATLIPADGESDYETNVEDERLYAFDVMVYYETKNIGLDTALDRLYDVGDDILDSFAQDKHFTGISMPAGKTLLVVEPVFCGWQELSDSQLVFIKISIKAHVSVSNI